MTTPFCPILNRYCLGSACVRFVPEQTTNVDGEAAVWRVGMFEPGGFFRDGQMGFPDTKATGRGWCADNLRALPFKDPNPATEK